jgi:hypothetical protein
LQGLASVWKIERIRKTMLAGAAPRKQVLPTVSTTVLTGFNPRRNAPETAQGYECALRLFLRSLGRGKSLPGTQSADLHRFLQGLAPNLSGSTIAYLVIVACTYAFAQESEPIKFRGAYISSAFFTPAI